MKQADSNTIQPNETIKADDAALQIEPIRFREMKHDPHCDCGICPYCGGREDVYGNSTECHHPYHPRLLAEVTELKAEVDRLKAENHGHVNYHGHDKRDDAPGPCAICETPLVVIPDGGHWTCYKCALIETEELWSQSLDKAKLRNCIECGAPAFAISPLNPSIGFCWDCRKLLAIDKL